MAQKGRKKGCTDAEAEANRYILYDAYDRLIEKEKSEDWLRMTFLPRSYYVVKLFDLHIVPLSKTTIRRLLMHRYIYDRRGGK
jgi:hypothetical protein